MQNDLFSVLPVIKIYSTAAANSYRYIAVKTRSETDKKTEKWVNRKKLETVFFGATDISFRYYQNFTINGG